MAGDQGVLVGAGAMHPVQSACHAETSFVEPGDFSGGDTVADDIEELV
jgi:hypothetical protein